MLISNENTKEYKEQSLLLIHGRKKKHRPGNNLMCVDSVGAAKRFRQTKISQLQHSAAV